MTRIECNPFKLVLTRYKRHTSSISHMQFSLGYFGAECLKMRCPHLSSFR